MGQAAKESNASFGDIGHALQNHSFPLWSLDENEDQILLSACAGRDGKWVLATLDEMPAKCGGHGQHLVDTSGKTMNCGEGVALCGVLTLESGLGRGAYHHNKPTVHGLWPETGDYGTSECIAPKNLAAPTKIYDCYKH